jgi:FkbM family methyltransferase
MLEQYTITYAQNREDIILDGFFEATEKGFYVDIGAYDPEYDSVTKLFYKKGWRGVNVEPQPDRFQAFTEKRPRDINVNAGVSNTAGELALRSYKNQGLSTFSEEMKNDYSKASSGQTEEYQDIKVKVLTLRQLLKDHKVTSIQFMKIDVEGLEYEVLEGNDWKKYRPEVICIEANHIKKDWRSLLTENGYSLTFFDGLNDYYTDNHTNRASHFDYVQAVVFREPIIPVSVAKDLETRDEAVAWQRAELEALGIHTEDLQKKLDEIISLRRHLKHSARYWVSKLDKQMVQTLTPKSKYRPKHVPLLANTSRDAIELHEAALTNDLDNFREFNRPLIKNPVLPAYIKTRNGTLRIAQRIRKRGQNI